MPFATAPFGYAFPVAQGTNTFDFRVSLLVGNGVEAYAGQLAAIFVPFGYNGGTTLAP